jgi:hypothetical protein
MMSFEEIESLFSSHQLDADGKLRMKIFRDKYKKLAFDIMNGVKPSAERTLAIRRLHESMMQINVLISSEYPIEE